MPELRRSARVASKPVEEPAVQEPAKKKVKTESKPAKVVKDVKDAIVETVTGKTAEIEVGDSIPDLTLLDENEKEVSLVEAAKKNKYLVIFAYPKASTPGCTRQACGFQTNYEFLRKANTGVFGLSADAPKSQKNFVTKQHLEYPLLSDPSRKLIGALGAKKSPTGIKRSHWIFVDGVLKVKKIQISPEASINTAKSDIEEFIAKDEGSSKSEPKEEVKAETEAKPE